MLKLRIRPKSKAKTTIKTDSTKKNLILKLKARTEIIVPKVKKLKLVSSEPKTNLNDKIDSKNPYIEEVKRMSKEHIVSIWKIGFIRAKNKKLFGDDLFRYMAVKTILALKYGVILPKDTIKLAS